MATVYYHDDYILQGAAPAGYTPAGGAAPMDHSGAGVYPGAMGDTASNLTPIQQQVVFVLYVLDIGTVRPTDSDFAGMNLLSRAAVPLVYGD